MEESRYNYFADNGNKIICLNGITGRILCLGKNEYAFFRNILVDPKLQKAHPEITTKLRRGHFLVENNEAELNYLRNINQAAKDSDRYELTLNPTMNCNFKCWYCYEKHVEGSMSEETIRRIKQFASKKMQMRGIKHFSLSWFGGEPLLYFDEIIFPLSSCFKEEALKLELSFSNHITTNGFLLNMDVAKKCEEIGLSFFQITLDGDRETHNKIRNSKGSPSFDCILANCIYLLNISNRANITLRINYTTKSICRNYAEILNEIPQNVRSRVKVQFQRVWQTYEKEGNDDFVKKSIEENQFALENAGFVNSRNTVFSLYRGNVCYADKRQYANINYDGLVYKCTAKDYTAENALGYIDERGDIIWHDEKLERMNNKANFDNPLCLSCDYLPLCGGPCFNKRSLMEKSGKYSCLIKNMDTDIKTFINESYNSITKKREKVLL